MKDIALFQLFILIQEAFNYVHLNLLIFSEYNHAKSLCNSAIFAHTQLRFKLHEPD